MVITDEQSEWSSYFNGQVHMEKYFWNLIKSNLNQIVFTIFRLIWNQTNVCLVPNQSENGKYYLISVWFNKISRKKFCVYTGSLDEKVVSFLGTVGSTQGAKEIYVPEQS